ncbi:MAG: phosphodiester glycosidase family protein [Armatimonadota bacterium]|nr:phosphodiester glycosidase family protein [Armatimonadota bacterium]
MRRKIILILVWLLSTISLQKIAAGTNVAYTKRFLHGVPVHVVSANLNSPNIRVSAAMSKRGIGTTEGFGSMLSRLQPTAAITGTYFCTRTLFPVGNIVIDGRLVALGHVGTGICFTQDNKVEFKRAKFLGDNQWAAYSTLICAGPRLVTNGIAGVYPRAEGFRDRRLYAKSPRSAIGITNANKLLLVVVSKPIYLSTLAKIMRELGAVNAINLDGGGSTALYYEGKVLRHPTRQLTNLIVVYESPEQFARIKSQLAPTPTVAARRTKAQLPSATAEPAAMPMPIRTLAVPFATVSFVESSMDNGTAQELSSCAVEHSLTTGDVISVEKDLAVIPESPWLAGSTAGSRKRELRGPTHNHALGG